MADAFKNLINAARVREAGEHLARSWPGFNRAAFEKQALHKLDTLELKARAMQVADALEAALPDDFHHAAQVIENALGPAGEGDGLGFASDHQGLAGWICWSLGEVIARRGIAHPARAFDALHAITQRFSAEFAIRPLLLAHPEQGVEILMRWSTDASAHVRRLASEGSRPRLPWGVQLKPFIADPTPMLPLLRALQDDESAYVRRSVANHLNDIAKDHPDILADWLQTHLPDASAQRRALLKHASRTLIKKGHPAVLKAWGIGGKYQGEAALKVAPRRVHIGDAVQLTLELKSTARSKQRLAVDYAVHHVKANGSTSAKVFKGWQLELAPGETRTLAKKHSLKIITTRRYYPGKHRITVQVNGRDVAEAEFSLEG